MSTVNLGSCQQCDCQLAMIYDARHPLDPRDPKSKQYRQLVVCGGCGLPHPEHALTVEGAPPPPPPRKVVPPVRPAPAYVDPRDEKIRALEERIEALESRPRAGRPRKADQPELAEAAVEV
jgi:hypothetical protein